jgi:serine/arginine repetitive matrix protein 2
MSAFRPRDGPPNGGAFGTGANAFGGADDFARTSRGPDQGILEHERKRAVEVKCAELEDALEEKGCVWLFFLPLLSSVLLIASATLLTALHRVPEDEILDQVTALRTRLLAQLPQARDVKSLKPSDTHALAEAKTAQLARFSGAFGISQGYREGAAFDRDEQERIRAAKRAEYEEKDRLRLERAREAEREEEVRREAVKVARREDERRCVCLLADTSVPRD